MNNFKNSLSAKYISLILALVLMVSTFGACGKKEEPETTAPTTTTTTEPTTISPYKTGEYNPLTGEFNYPKKLIGSRPVMISVENHIDARPQWGITTADVVWEMVVEGGITRMLLMYADPSRIPDQVGPMRSARHYFVELAEGFDAIFVHMGGSPQAYNALSKQGTDNIDSVYKRDQTRNTATEHRAYTTNELVNSHIENNKIRTKVEKGYENPFSFNYETVKLPDGKATKFTVPFSNYCTYTLTYNKKTKLYKSSIGDNPFMDDNGKQQSFTNIIMCYVDVSDISGDKKGRKTFDLSSGEGVYISNGTYQAITWEKGGYTDMMKFYVANGNSKKQKEISLNAGRTYIALVPTSMQGNVIIE